MESVMRKSAFLIILAAAAAAPVSAAAPQPEKGEAALQQLLAGRVAGKPVSCLSLPQLGSSQVIDGTAIVYRSGSRLYVNRPEGGAESLRSDNILVTRTSIGMLCNVDTVDLMDRSSRAWTGFVRLGDFVPYDRPRPVK
jgi:hypothetical protein